jgi:hypothetical protein
MRTDRIVATAKGWAMRWFTACALLAVSVAGSPTNAFEVDGYSTGMSVADLQKAVEQAGYQLRTLTVSATAYAAARLDEKGSVVDVIATFNTCQGKLIDYAHRIDFDVDYANVLESTLREFGQPQKVYVTRQPLGGGYVVNNRMRWYQGQDRVELYFSPEVRTSKGELRFARGAEISYSTKNSCWSATNW